ncbi:formimidoylglutamate deiminase [uncultured Azohydromonas sp.]|uniref:formimidoylglutamate deiminase n=1 Tax=uncultured Azohydromonas sp. TaxID=487342 RepID=UPI0026057310|nr:formimidoylglutamate deiminase [uncultured Azohydromonas sp.]
MLSQLWAPRAWLPGGWRERVLLEVGRDGRWLAITPDRDAPPGAEIAAGPLLPALVDAHSHAFQRAFAGLAETREGATEDDFWSWRERMYGVASRITAGQLCAVAAQLYVELLRGGYTQVCEFHYLQRDPEGQPYADPLTLGWALADAAAEAGIGLTLLPALYERAGFTLPALREEQRRFALDAQGAWEAARRVREAGRPLLSAGLAIHSLRAAAPVSILALRDLSEDFEGPIHIHVAEQSAEVEQCLGATGERPIQWLYGQGLLDPRWHLVHATHATRKEIAAVDASEAGVVLCPSTEANLGDGLADLPGWLAAGVGVSIGSDSQVSRDAVEELRWLEYGQRLHLRRRNLAAAPGTGQPSTAARLLDVAVHAGARAAGEPAWGLVEGARADALVADAGAGGLLGVPAERLLDALLFAGPTRPWRDVLVAGRWVIREGRHPEAEAIAQRFSAAMLALWSGG